MSDGHPAPHDRPSGGSGSSLPASDLGEIWEALDALPRANASIDMAATTVDMAAVTRGRSTARPALRVGGGRPGAWREWLLPAVAVAGSLMAGIVAGRVTAPDPDVRILEYLPLVRHLPLLEEAGSVKFLQALAARRNQQPLRMPPEMLRGEEQEFDAEVADLQQDHAVGSAARPLLDDRRMAIAILDADDRDVIERSAAAFQALTKAEQRDLATVAAVLADPAREELRAAARLWHLIIAASDPPDRKNIIELDAEERLEWLERRSRMRDWMIERRGQPPAPEGGPLPPRGPRGEGGPPGLRGDGRGRGEPGSRFEAGPRGDRGGVRPEEPRPRPPFDRAPPEPPPPEPASEQRSAKDGQN
jgi:hypothetical protein